MSDAWHPERVIEPRFAWRIADPVTPPAELLDAAAGLGIGSRATSLLVARGVLTAAELESFFAEPGAALHDPRLLPDAAVFLERLHRARDSAETVMVFGDFDADGLTGLAILVRALRRFGVTAIPHVPSRIDDGHGLSLRAVAEAHAAAATVIVTVDCGSTSVAEIAAAAQAGMQAGDRILALGEIPVAGEPSFVRFRAEYGGREGAELPIKVRRGGQELTLTSRVRLATLTEERLTFDPAASPKALRVRRGIFTGE